MMTFTDALKKVLEARAEGWAALALPSRGDDVPLFVLEAHEGTIPLNLRPREAARLLLEFPRPKVGRGNSRTRAKFRTACVQSPERWG